MEIMLKSSNAQTHTACFIIRSFFSLSRPTCVCIVYAACAAPKWTPVHFWCHTNFVVAEQRMKTNALREEGFYWTVSKPNELTPNTYRGRAESIRTQRDRIKPKDKITEEEIKKRTSALFSLDLNNVRIFPVVDMLSKWDEYKIKLNEKINRKMQVARFRVSLFLRM